jgi:hypothetical protein
MACYPADRAAKFLVGMIVTHTAAANQSFCFSDRKHRALPQAFQAITGKELPGA